MAYEEKMSVVYDNVAEKLTVYFRGRKYEWNKKFPDDATARKFGEQHCRMLGWAG
ncbi:hypothetical protein SAMN05443582_11544 [Phyllobacterium sp. OV277]|nr:hypothetical protein SAMN05443582_11544 [Phyllobacterium sp. OV277]